MATGEIRASILHEWLHKAAPFTEADAATGVSEGDPFTEVIFDQLLREEYDKLLEASDRDVHDDSKETTLPIARTALERYVRSAQKLPWFIDLLNINLDHGDLAEAEDRIERFIEAFTSRGERLTE